MTSPPPRNTQAGVDVILTPNTPGEELKIGSTLSCTVEQVMEATGATTIPQGKLILSISNQSGGNGFRRSSAPWPPGTPWTSASPPRTPAGRT